MRASSFLVLGSTCLLIGCAATPAQRLAYLESNVAHSDGYVTGSHIRQTDLSYDPEIVLVGPASLNNTADNTVSAALLHSPAGADIQFYNR